MHPQAGDSWGRAQDDFRQDQISRTTQNLQKGKKQLSKLGWFLLRVFQMEIKQLFTSAREKSLLLPERADESGTLADQSGRVCEQVYGGNEGLYLFGKT